MTKKMFGALLASVILTSAAFAHDPKPQSGGRIADAGDYHVELVTKAGVVDVYLSDHNNKSVSSAGHKGIAILVVEGKSQRIVLEPAGEARLSGKAAGALPDTAKGVVQITLPKGKTVQARFN